MRRASSTHDPNAEAGPPPGENEMAKITDKDYSRLLKMAARAKGVTKAEAASALKSKNRGSYVLSLLRKQRKVKAVDLKTLLKPGKLGKAARTKTFVLAGKK